jgi:putative spermidine/putrescine transport system permease protein
MTQGAAPARTLLRIYCGIVILFLLAPVLILVATSFTASATVDFPPTSFSLRWYRKLISHLQDAPGVKSGLLDSLLVSLKVAAIATVLALIAGVIAAYGLHLLRHSRFRFLQHVFMLPVILPQIVTGVSVLLLFSEIGLTGAENRLVLGHAFLVLPYVLLTVSATLNVVGIELEEAAVGLGCGRVRAFLTITLPLIAPAVSAGALFSFVISFNTFTLSFFLYSGQARPLSIWIYEYMIYFQDPTLAALSTLLIAATLGVIFVLDRLVGLNRATRT